MKLYHGTYCGNIKEFKIIERNLELNDLHNGTDLGPGVFFTNNKRKAIEWACHKGRNKGYVYIVDINLKSLNGLIKLEPDEDYCLLCAFSRTNRASILDEIDGYTEADYIRGKVVKNTKEFEELSNYLLDENTEDWQVAFKEYKDKIRFYKSYEQYCFKSKKALELLNRNIVGKLYVNTNKIIKEVKF